MPRLALLAPLLLLTAAAPALPGVKAAVAPPPATHPPAAAPHAAPPAAAAPAGSAAATTAPAAAVLPATPTTAADFLAVAAQLVAQHQAKPALRALGRAETRLLSRSVPLFHTRQQDSSTPVRLIEQARQALRAGDFAAADSLIARAMPLVATPAAPPTR